MRGERQDDMECKEFEKEGLRNGFLNCVAGENEGVEIADT